MIWKSLLITNFIKRNKILSWNIRLLLIIAVSFSNKKWWLNPLVKSTFDRSLLKNSLSETDWSVFNLFSNSLFSEINTSVFWINSMRLEPLLGDIWIAEFPLYTKTSLVFAYKKADIKITIRYIVQCYFVIKSINFIFFKIINWFFIFLCF